MNKPVGQQLVRNFWRFGDLADGHDGVFHAFFFSLLSSVNLSVMPSSPVSLRH
jgi:hypothetical protein